MMKRLFITILIILFTVTLTWAATAKIAFEKTAIDFGEAQSGKIVELEFKFQNTGDDTLVIKNIASSCGCTVTQVDKKEYKPGEKGVIPVKFLTQGYNGKVVKTITVSSNDPENVYTRLTLSGNVELKDFAEAEIVTSDRIDFKELKVGEKASEKIKIKNKGTIDLRIIEVTHDPEITMEFDKKIVPPNDEVEITVGFKAMQAGRFAAFPRIRTNAYRQRSLIIKVNAEVKEN
jgi:P pilus assembly chaperone PapD